MELTVNDLLKFIDAHPEIDKDTRIGCLYDDELAGGSLSELRVEDNELVLILLT